MRVADYIGVINRPKGVTAELIARRIGPDAFPFHQHEKRVTRFSPALLSPTLEGFAGRAVSEVPGQLILPDRLNETEVEVIFNHNSSTLPSGTALRLLTAPNDIKQVGPRLAEGVGLGGTIVSNVIMTLPKPAPNTLIPQRPEGDYVDYILASYRGRRFAHEEWYVSRCMPIRNCPPELLKFQNPELANFPQEVGWAELIMNHLKVRAMIDSASVDARVFERLRQNSTHAYELPGLTMSLFQHNTALKAGEILSEFKLF